MKILGIDLGGTNIRAGLVENNSLLKITSAPVTKNGSEKEVLNDVFNLIASFSTEKISGIGIGVPSVVDVEKGIVYDVQNIPSWKEVHLKDLLTEKFNMPVYVNNDANCFAVGEKYFGKAKDYKNIVGLIIGTGLGSGLIINNKLYSGKNCGAGEFGNIQYKNKTYEYFCSGHFFVNEYKLTGEELFMQAGNGNSEAINIFAEFGKNLGEVIKVIMYTVDPEIIILGGSISKSFKYFKDEMFRSINEFTYSNSVMNIKIEVSEIENIAVLGAAGLFFDNNIK
jgi:glucokinase